MAQFVTIDLAEDPGFGLGAFGTASFGGTAGFRWTIPDLEVPSTDPEEEEWLIRDEIVQKRRGAVVGARQYTQRQKFRFAWAAMDMEDVRELSLWFKRGIFYLIPDPIFSPQTKYKVYWPGEFKPQRLRGPYYRVNFILEEVL